MRYAIAFAGWIGFLGIAAANGADEWANYRPTTLQAIFDAQLPGIVGLALPNQSVILDAPEPSSVRVTYTGKQRRLSPAGMELLKEWLENYQLKTPSVPEIHSEYLFLEGGKEYWLAVQPGSETRMLATLHSGDMVTLYIALLGESYPAGKQPPSLQGGRPITWLFVVDGFAN